MMQSFPIDFLIRIKNASRAGKKTMIAPSSKFCVSIADLLKRYGYIADYSVSDEAMKKITIDLIYQNNQPKISEVKLFSTPGRRVYGKVTQLPWEKLLIL